MVRLIFVVALVVFSIAIGYSLSKDFKKILDNQSQKIASVELN